MTLPVTQKAVVPDFHEALGQQVQTEPAQKLPHVQRHGFSFAAVGVIPPGKGHGVALRVQRQQPARTDRDAVRVTRQVSQHLQRPGERLFGVHHPFLLRRGMVFADGRPLRQVYFPADLAEATGVFWVEEPGLRLHLRPKRRQCSRMISPTGRPRTARTAATRRGTARATP